MFEVTVEETFAAGHALRNYKGKCENVHGHNYKIRVVLAGEELDSAGLLYDFVELRRHMAEVIRALDHQFLNDLPAFKEVNPSAENIARYFYTELARRLQSPPNGALLREVTVFESDSTAAAYRP
jgi:6-pyruvoyltetrahydropterin/6-carboxytetrahydropterin synthase